MYTYRINVAVRITRRDTTPSSAYRHFFDITCEPHRYTEDGVREVVNELRNKFPSPKFQVDLTRSHTTSAGMDIQSFISMNPFKKAGQ